MNYVKNVVVRVVSFGARGTVPTGTNLGVTMLFLLSLVGLAGVATFVATDDDDTIIGTADDDTIDGGAGNDTITGQRGDDLLFGGEGDDDIQGSQDNDTIFGGTGDDDLRGAQNDDDIFGEAGNDLVFGDLGQDSLDGGLGFDTLNGGPGADTLSGGPDADTVRGGSGNDLIMESDDGAPGVNTDLLFGQNGHDTISGSSLDIISGGQGNDVLTVDNVSDETPALEISGDGGDDVIVGPALSVEGGSGDDLIAGGVNQASGDDGNDTIVGGPNADVLGGEGEDEFIVDERERGGPVNILDYDASEDTIVIAASELGPNAPEDIVQRFSPDTNSIELIVEDELGPRNIASVFGIEDETTVLELTVIDATTLDEMLAQAVA
ncbi:calcium-binding protein [Tateyamaria sp. ANG-S1]|uniref:calcium-binding protein n=1 Tax=Tateyamaria sp. ANG-S1 TaxID=1577905 RepID=UPI00068F7695|nr:calcium-binding protein [Tateyamaria sp. ANG-S1]